MTFSTFSRLYQEYQESGLNIKDFCANQAIAPSTFYYWRHKLEETSQHQPASFVPLVFDSNQPARERQTIPAITKNSPTSSNLASIEFVFPNGTKMVLRDNNVDMGLLKTIVHLYD